MKTQTKRDDRPTRPESNFKERQESQENYF